MRVGGWAGENEIMTSLGCFVTMRSLPRFRNGEGGWCHLKLYSVLPRWWSALQSMPVRLAAQDDLGISL